MENKVYDFLKEKMLLLDYVLPPLLYKFNHTRKEHHPPSSTDPCIIQITHWKDFYNSKTSLPRLEFDAFHKIVRYGIIKSESEFKNFAKLLLIYPSRLLLDFYDLSWNHAIDVTNFIGVGCFVIHSDSINLAVYDMISSEVDLADCEDCDTCSCLQSLYGTMVMNRLPFGIISNYNYTRFLYVHGSLQVSDAIPYSSPLYFKYMTWFALQLKESKRTNTIQKWDLQLDNHLLSSSGDKTCAVFYKSFAWTDLEFSNCTMVHRTSFSSYKWRCNHRSKDIYVRVCDMQRQPLLYERMRTHVQFLNHLIALQGYTLPRLLLQSSLYGFYIYVLEWIENEEGFEYDLQTYSEYCRAIRLQLIDMGVIYMHPFMNPKEQTRVNQNKQIILTDLSRLCWLN